ncbi:ferredoxin:thioredoxin reductase [Candidatus Woesearchaeota archaeon]|nr:ferredoxin:thioredoxin reductase [Candidatus Woesearchaeota archaeon]
MGKEELIKELEKHALSNDLMLNPKKEAVDLIAEGLLRNEKKHGMRLCPCRLRDGTKERDLELLCPCNFKQDESWIKKGCCHCGLFWKK